MAVTANTVRPAAVAGSFYPAEPGALRREIADFLDSVPALEPRFTWPKALVVPHAGYIYSGAYAAHAYDCLAPGRGSVRRIVLLGPTHRVACRGMAMPSVDAFETPLGTVQLDRAAIDAIASIEGLGISDEVHRLEHAIEVQLPFLQSALEAFELVPLAVGSVPLEILTRVIEQLWGGPETVIVVSTDLSHYHDYESARRIDRDSILRIAKLAGGLSHEQACGATPLNALLAVARRRQMRIRLLAAGNSGDTAGGRSRVVGYGAFALHEAGDPDDNQVSAALLDIAERAIAKKVGARSNAAAPTESAPALPWLRHHGASFVTLKTAGRLRGCIGSLSATKALGDDVAENAVAAALRDPRFSPLASAEWPSVSVEVSVLSTPKPIRFADEAELLESLEPGADGLIIEFQCRRGTFLPQVWDDIPEKRRFLAALMAKAGIPADTRLARCRILRYRVRKYQRAAATGTSAS